MSDQRAVENDGSYRVAPDAKESEAPLLHEGQRHQPQGMVHEVSGDEREEHQPCAEPPLSKPRRGHASRPVLAAEAA